MEDLKHIVATATIFVALVVFVVACALMPPENTAELSCEDRIQKQYPGRTVTYDWTKKTYYVSGAKVTLRCNGAKLEIVKIDY